MYIYIYIYIIILLIVICLIVLFWKRENSSLLRKKSMAEALIDDPVYVAVSTDVSESRLTLTWALRHLQPKKLYLLHVHQPISINPTC